MQFKDRLVEYGRESARRTRVVDDQSDYYQIDSSVWLSTEVRLKQRVHRDLCSSPVSGQLPAAALELLGSPAASRTG